MKLFFIAPAMIAIATTGAFAQDRNGPPKMPTAEIASALNVSESVAENYLMPNGQNGSQEAPKGPVSEVQMAELLSCLQSDNSN